MRSTDYAGTSLSNSSPKVLEERWLAECESVSVRAHGTLLAVDGLLHALRRPSKRIADLSNESPPSLRPNSRLEVPRIS